MARWVWTTPLVELGGSLMLRNPTAGLGLFVVKAAGLLYSIAFDLPSGGVSFDGGVGGME
jgi:hypothetical protein